MRIIVIAALAASFTLTALVPVGALAGPSISGPTQAPGGSVVNFTGTSGGAGPWFSVADDNGPVDHSVSWHGNGFTLTVTLPAYDPSNPDNAVVVTITDSTGSADATCKITP